MKLHEYFYSERINILNTCPVMPFQHFKQPVVDFNNIEEDKRGEEKKDAKAGKERGGRSMRRIDLFGPYCHEVRGD